jgi:IS605 OrfB family transposase
MKLAVQVKLVPDDVQRAALLATVERINEACNDASARAWQTKTFRQFDLHKLVYRDLRERFSLSAQVAVRAIAKVADAYKLDRKTRRTFRPRGAVCYDSRILHWYDDSVSIWSTVGRLRIPFVCGARQRAMLAGRKGESDLVSRDGEFFLLATVDVAEKPLLDCPDAIGVDLGIVNIASDSDGKAYSGEHLNNLRRRHRRLRRKLQAKGTRSARKLLNKRRRKESRFSNDVNHCISKQLVAKAERTKRAIALEDLKGIRQRVRARRPQRATLHSWAFNNLGQKIAYKARLAGVPVIFVDPRDTSRTCPACGSISKANRPTRDEFCCTVCGLAGPADHIAAENIRRAALVSRPIVAAIGRETHSCDTSPRLATSPAL